MRKPIDRSKEVSFTKAQLQWLEKKFVKRIHYPGTALELIMFENGQQSVLQAIRESTAGVTYGETFHVS